VASHAQQPSTNTNAPTTASAPLFKCQPKNSKVAAPPPFTPTDPQGNTATKNSYTSPCSAGLVPVPTETHGPKQEPKGLVKQDKANGPLQPRSSVGGYWYSWSEGQQEVSNKGITQLFAAQTNHEPWFNFNTSYYGHSLGQIWALDYSNPAGFSDVETGWSESLGQFGNYSPHLFVYHFDQGVGMGYAPNGGWVQYSSFIYPNMPLTHGDGYHWYGVANHDNNWWISYDGNWVGYYPPSAFPRYLPHYLTTVEAGGEVATQEYNTCSDMGNKYPGTSPSAAKFEEVYWTNSSGYPNYATLTPYNSDPNNYTTGNWYGGFQFRYGGGGWC
jgi:hypothetical protein